ncbi:hypothetical protein BDP27DRAFT_1362159 [Rhodocollybia butyracea]|uniref:Uncharacterized protein n=1 Tax=Rhodocollybia butyracea TaxID=206335 RepID=A0A9P5PXJ0_9AGAR|nr:hypothetical protein BDP27DRAFT_1362159 [Rhodocollybia butyracea]
MRFAVPYASFLLVASFSCIWATPIVVNRDTLIQRRSESDLGLKIGSLEARGVGPSSMAQEAISESRKAVISDFLFISMVLEPNPEKVKEAVRELIERGLRRTGVRGEIFSPVEGFEKLPAEVFKKFPGKSSQVEFTFNLTYKLKRVSYSGILMDLSGKNTKEDADSGILYRAGTRIYVRPAAPPATYLHS